MPTKEESPALIIRRKRLELGLTQTELAAKLGVKVRAVQRYESGEMQPKRSVMMLLAALTNRGPARQPDERWSKMPEI